MSNEIKVTEYISDIGLQYKLTVNGISGAIANESPFGNCQGWGIKKFDHIVFYLKDKSEIVNIISSIKEACKIYKPFLMLDINLKYYNQIKDYLTINSLMSYTNANGSPMMFLIVDTRTTV